MSVTFLSFSELRSWGVLERPWGVLGAPLGILGGFQAMDGGKRASSAIEVVFQVRKDPLGGVWGGSARLSLGGLVDSIAQGPRIQSRKGCFY